MFVPVKIQQNTSNSEPLSIFFQISKSYYKNVNSHQRKTKVSKSSNENELKKAERDLGNNSFSTINSNPSGELKNNILKW